MPGSQSPLCAEKRAEIHLCGALSANCSISKTYWLEKEVSAPTRRHADSPEDHLLLK